uniref:Putative secreted protein n=1 Tax=Ixodes ricinus TaxID=34613 RepID=A0A6B0UHM9_IXORI
MQTAEVSIRPASDGATFSAILVLLAGCSLAFPRSTQIAEIGSGSKQASNSEQFEDVESGCIQSGTRYFHVIPPAGDDDNKRLGSGLKLIVFGNKLFQKDALVF